MYNSYILCLYISMYIIYSYIHICVHDCNIFYNYIIMYIYVHDLQLHTCIYIPTMITTWSCSGDVPFYITRYIHNYGATHINVQSLYMYIHVHTFPTYDTCIDQPHLKVLDIGFNKLTSLEGMKVHIYVCVSVCVCVLCAVCVVCVVCVCVQ